jgi:lysophospholipase L1-like esterase
MHDMAPVLKTVLWIIFLILVWVTYIAVRSKYYLTKSQVLFDTSLRFQKDYYVGQIKDNPLTYLAMGDSTAVGTGVYAKEESYPYAIALRLAQQGHYVHVINTAKSGARLNELLLEQLPTLTKTTPDVISVTIGANDATHFTDLKSYEQDLVTLKNTLPQKANALLATSPSMSLIPALPYPYNIAVGNRCEQQNALLLKVFGNSQVKIIDIYNHGPLRTIDKYATDRFHPSSLGYDVWAHLFVQELH